MSGHETEDVFDEDEDNMNVAESSADGLPYGDDPLPEEISIKGYGDIRRKKTVQDGGLSPNSDSRNNRHSRLSLAPPEEIIELSQVFRSRLGLCDIDEDRIQTLTREKSKTVTKYRFKDFAEKYFQEGHVPRCNADQLPQPLLPKTDDLNVKASLNIWRAIQKFANCPHPRQDTTARKGNNPIMVIVCRQFERRRSSGSGQQAGKDYTRSSSFEANNKNGSRGSIKLKMPSLKALKQKFQSSVRSKKGRPRSDEVPMGNERSGSIDNDVIDGDINDDSDSDNIPVSDLDIVHYIIAHGIVRKELRDEIFCQLCCLVSNNASREKSERGWTLHALCAGCFLPSSELLDYYYAFLHDVSPDMADQSKYIMNLLNRTNANGLRFHPPNWCEMQAVKEQKKVLLQVMLPDGRTVPVQSDSAITASEICDSLATTLGITDSFGFSIYVAILAKVSSMGSGMDHLMDAITECEQVMRRQGKSEEDVPYRLFYRKELFTPWHDSTLDAVSTNLIYKQILEGMRQDEYSLPTMKDLDFVIARLMYVDKGATLNLSEIKAKLPSYYPTNVLEAKKKVLDVVARSVMAQFESQGLPMNALSSEEMKSRIVSDATTIWPMHFAALFEASRRDRSNKGPNDVIISVNKEGVTVLNPKYQAVIGFHYYDLLDVIADNCNEVRVANVRLRIVNGSVFTFLSPNAETIAKMISAFLDGLRRRSVWAIVVQPFTLKDYTSVAAGGDFQLETGDLVILDDVQSFSPSPATSAPRESSTSSETSLPSKTEWLRGRCERSGISGSFPEDVVFVLPTLERPVDEFVKMMKTANKSIIDGLPRRHGVVIGNERGDSDQSRI